MKPNELNRHLLRLARPARPLLAVAVAAGLFSGALLVVQAVLLAHVITAGFLGRRPLAELAPDLALVAGVFALRAALGFAGDLAGSAAADRVRTMLRVEVAGALTRMSPSRLAGERAGELAAALTRGVEALDGYFGRYLPQLALAVAVPLLVIGWTLPHDWVAAGILAATVPLVPVFMALIGLAARSRTERQWKALAILSAHFLDLVRGLPTLRAFARGAEQEANVRRVTEQYRRATMATLRVAFLSSLVLELAGTISTALVAVAIGLRLDAGGMSLENGLAILILAPEVYLPLRRLGAQFHSGLEALAPAERLFQLAAESPAVAGGRHRPHLRLDAVALRDVSFAHAGRPALLEHASLVLQPGDHVALLGASGCGKTTLVALLLGFEAPAAGAVLAGGVPLTRCDLRAYRDQVAWLSQRPALFAGSVADNLRLGRPSATAAELEAAAAAAGLDVPLARPVGEAGRELSAGQRVRLGLARTLLRQAPLTILDEPTANLDAGARTRVAALLRAHRGSLLLVTHDRELAAACDRTYELAGGRLVPTGMAVAV